MNRKLEILIGVVIVLALVLFIGIGIFNTVFDNEAIIGKIADAIDNNDIDYLKRHIEVEGIKKDSLTVDELTNIVETLKNNISRNSLKDYYENPQDNIYLKKKGKENILFDKYTLVLRPYSLSIESNIPGSEVYIDDEKVGVFDKGSNEFNYENMLPGKHSIKLIYKGEYGDLEQTEEIICFNMSESEVYTNIYLDGQYVDIHSNIENATLYINDKDTKINLSDGYNLGPIPIDGSINIMAKANIDGEVYESEETSIYGYTSYYNLYIDYEESIEEVFEETAEVIYQNGDINGSITALMEGYQYGMVEAINNANYSYVQAFIEGGSPLSKSQVNLVKHLSSKGTTEKLMDYTIHDITEVSDNIFEVQVSEQHNIFYSSGTNDTVSNKWIYTVIKQGDFVYLRDLRK